MGNIEKKGEAFKRLEENTRREKSIAQVGAEEEDGDTAQHHISSRERSMKTGVCAGEGSSDRESSY